MTDPVLELRGVTKAYRRGGARSLEQRFTRSSGSAERVAVLKGVDLTVERGEVVGIVGRNGGGKSTLLRVAGGLTAATSGTVVRRASVSGLLALNASASGDLSGADNALTAAVLAGLSPREARARLGDIAEFAELDEEVLRRPLRTYSDGMKLRLAFAAAISTAPELLLIDEVLAVGDLSFQEKCLARVQALAEAGCAVLVASHVLPHVRRLATRAVWLRSGVVHAHGDAGEVLDTYERSLDEQSGPPRELGGGGFRKGTGAVLLDDIRCAGPGDTAPGTTVVGGGVTVRLDYRRQEPVEHAHFGIALRRVGAELPLVDLTTEGSGAGALRLEDQGSVSVVLDRVDLEPGEYWVDAGIYSADWDAAYDYQWDRTRLLVAGPGTHGTVQPPHTWRAS